VKVKIVPLVISIFLTVWSFETKGQTYTVAVTSTPPLVYADEAGQPAGLFIDLLKHMADRESWQIEFVQMTFDEGLSHLKNGTIDIMPNLAVSKERSEYAIYNKVSVGASWGQVFAIGEFETFLDLENVKIGHLVNDFFMENPEDGLKALCNQYEVNAEYVPLNSYEEVTQHLKDGSIDVGVYNRIYGINQFYQNDLIDFNDIHETPIIFSPITLHFAFPKTENLHPQLAATIDTHLSILKKDKNSIYYKLAKLYLYPQPGFNIPIWIKILVALLGGGVVLLFTFNSSLKKQVDLKTKKISESKQKIEESTQKLILAINSAKEGIWEWDILSDSITVDRYSYNLLGYNYAGQTMPFSMLTERIHPDDIPLFQASLKHHFENRTEFHEVEFRLKVRSGEAKWFQMHGKTVEFDKNNKPAKYLGTAIDIDDRKQNERAREQLVDALTGRNKELKCLFMVSQVVADVSKSLKVTVNDTLPLIVDAMKYPKLAYVNVTLEDQNFTTLNYKETEWRMDTDIVVNGAVKGKIEVGYLEKKPGLAVFSEEEENLLNALADQIGSMLDRKLLAEKLDESETQEREKISKELHDGVQQTLTVASLNLNYINDKLKDQKANKELHTKLETGIDNLDQAISELRDLAHELDINFTPAVEKMLMELGSVSEVKFSFFTNLGQERLGHKVERALFRITQEALNNIIKHAYATKATIQLMKYPDLTILTIEDNGKGFDSENHLEGFGIDSIKNRANKINGVCSIDSTPGKGTSITIEI